MTVDIASEKYRLTAFDKIRDMLFDYMPGEDRGDDVFMLSAIQYLVGLEDSEDNE